MARVRPEEVQGALVVRHGSHQFLEFLPHRDMVILVGGGGVVEPAEDASCNDGGDHAPGEVDITVRISGEDINTVFVGLDKDIGALDNEANVSARCADENGKGLLGDGNGEGRLLPSIIVIVVMKSLFVRT